jgi:hypothetical protein
VRAGLAAAGLAVGWSLPALAPVAPPVSALIGVERRLAGDGDGADVAITFDDGPHPEGTPAVLEVLRERHAAAPSSSSASRSSATARSPRRSPRPGTRSRSTAIGTGSSCGSRLTRSPPT